MESDSFDFIYSHITLQHIAPRFTKIYLKQFLRLLKPQGLLYFQLPSQPPAGFKGQLIAKTPNWLTKAYRSIRYGNEPIMEMNWISVAEITDLIQQAGGHIVKMQEKTLDDGFVNNWYFVVKN